jgi:hypothetical protein
MESFRDAFASAQEVKTVEDAVGIVVEHRWPQRFALRGDTVFGLCARKGQVFLTHAIFEAPNPMLFPQLLHELRAVFRNREQLGATESSLANR